MEVFINNQPVSAEPGNTLYILLSRYSLIEKKGIAVAVNNDVIHKGDWNRYVLAENDLLTIIRATQGG